MSPVLQDQDDSKVMSVIRDEFPVLYLALVHHHTHKRQRPTFHEHEYLRQIYSDNRPRKVLMKGTQCGISEWLIMWSIHRAMMGRSVFYVLPNEDLKRRFVRNRFDKSVMYTPYYFEALKSSREEGKGLGYMSDGATLSLKNFRNGTIGFVSSNSAPAFSEFPADDLVIDELDECNKKNIARAPERLGHSKYPHEIRVANPTYEGMGIDVEFGKSDQEYWNTKCPHCGHWQPYDYFKNIVRQENESNYVIRDREWSRDSRKDIRVICANPKCEKPIDRYASGEWIDTQISDIGGYQLNKLFASQRTILSVVERHENGLKNDTELERFYNGDLGIPYTPPGSKITKTMLNSCVRDFRMEPPIEGVCVAGVDVGKKLHVTIAKILPESKLQMVHIGTADSLQDIKELSKTYRVKIGVIDSMPEMRLARSVTGLSGWWRCFYNGSDAGQKIDSVNPLQKVVTVDRTQALDAVKETLVSEEMMLPVNAASIDEFYLHMEAATRTHDEEKNVTIWTEGSKADHYHHAYAYMLVAKRLLKIV